MKNRYTTMIAAIHTELWSTVIYAVIVTTFIAVKSYAFSEDLMHFISSIISAIKIFSGKVISVGKWCANISNGINSQNLNHICYFIITIMVALILAAIPVFIIYIAVSKYIRWYKQEISDHISIWVAVVTLAITIFFADGIKNLLPINLIMLNLLIHLIYSSIRAYVRGCKKQRGYY